jgi:hypothetical protein
LLLPAGTKNRIPVFVLIPGVVIELELGGGKVVGREEILFLSFE